MKINVLLMGDHLNGYSFFWKKTPDGREKVTDSFAPGFGKRFIVLPNPFSGHRESSLSHYYYSLMQLRKIQW